MQKTLLSLSTLPPQVPKAPREAAWFGCFGMAGIGLKEQDSGKGEKSLNVAILCTRQGNVYSKIMSSNYVLNKVTVHRERIYIAGSPSIAIISECACGAQREAGPSFSRPRPQWLYWRL